jgi:uncharacterized protein (TIGR00730 family)
VTVFGSSSSLPGDGWFERGLRCGRLLGEAGYAVATGGYAGLMEAVSRGASEAGARVIGVTAPTAFPGRPGANPWVDEEIAAASLPERIGRMVEMSAAFVALDGSIGTLTEMLMVWNVAYVDALWSKPTKPVVAVGERWRDLVPSLVTLLDTDGSTIVWVAGVDDAVAEVVRRVPASG